jgi:hypothetical protein
VWAGQSSNCVMWDGYSHRAGPLASSSPARPSRRRDPTRAQDTSTVALASVFFDSVAGMMQEHAAVLTDSHVADVGVDAEHIPVPGGQHEKGTNGERREERAHETAQQQAKQRLRPPARSTGSSRSLRNCLQLAHPPPPR